MIHKLAEVQAENIGQNTSVWQFSIVLKNAVIGDHCNINCHVFIENDVIIGDRVTIKPGVQIWDGLRISNDVFIGPNVTFVNDKLPRSKQYPDQFLQTQIQEKASIGANATILGGLNIGKYAMVGAGSVVTKDIPDRALVVGNPSRLIGWLSENGTQMKKIKDFKFEDNQGQIWIEQNQSLSKA
ncbi:N-acetyltransferase [Psychroflexus sp. CAK8W]|uniref:N-acetyltransferase n=1 Tax=Psychroflexus longus TaxID=2873596 RepID=A0ABS7XFH6_9FLAO|nr:acyltransferase [Psychroflexus longus]MBZ9777717.1 N-acetyltransferase [Psychroflexus longus]